MELQRKQKPNITMEQKLQALKNIDEGFSIANTAISLGVSYETVRSWKVNRKKIEDRSRMASSVNEKLDQAVFTWYNLQRKHCDISGSMIKAKALRLYSLMGGGNDFLASTGWLNSWKNRYGIKLQTNSGKSLSTFDSSEFDCFSRELQRVVEAEQLTQDQVFSCVETVFYYKLLPSRVSVTRTDISARGLLKNQDHVTVMACSNSSGSLMLPLMIIGKYPKPRALKGLKLDNLPALYRNDKNALMNSSLFQEWFNEEFVPEVSLFLQERKLPQKALLIIDHSPLHPPAEDLMEGSIKTMFFPSNVTPLMRPMDQSILNSLKRHYRFKLIESVLDAQNNNKNVFQHLKAITLRNLVFGLAGSWEKIACCIVKKAWHKIWPFQDSGEDNQEGSPQKHEDISNAQFLNILHKIEGCREVNDEDLEQWIRRDDEVMEGFSDQELISMVMESRKVIEEDEQEARCSSDGKNYESEDCQNGEKEYSDQEIKEEYTDMESLSNHRVIPMREENEDQENKSHSDWKVMNPVEGWDSPHIEETQDTDEERSWKRIKREYEAGDPLSSQGRISMVMETGEVEENGKKDNECSLDHKVVTAADAQDAAALLIHFFEKQGDTPQEGLMWLHMFKQKAASLKT